MPQFASPEELTTKLGGLFQDAVTDEELFRRLQKLDGIVRLQLKDPAAQITVKAKAGEPGVVDLGPSKLNPDVIVRLDGDTAHGWFSGELNPTVALSKGQMRATGAVDKILRLVPLAPALTEQYQAVLEHGGRLTEAPPEPEPEAAAPEAPAEGAEAPAQAEGPEVTTEATEGGEPAATEEPVAAEVVEEAPEAPAPAAEEEPAVAQAPAGEPEVVDAIGAEEPEAPAEEPAASEAPAEEPAASEAPAEEPAAAEAPLEEPAASEASAEEPAASEAPAEEPAASEAPAEEPAASEASAEEPAASEAPAEDAPQPDPAPEDEAPPQP